jgi:anti-anti-sigma factor
MDAELTIDHEVREGVDLLALTGDLDLVSVPRFDAALAGCDAAVLIVDLGDVGFVDSAGLRALDRTHRHVSEQGRSVRFVAPPRSPVRRTLDMVGFPSTAVAATVAEAIGSTGN